MIRLLFILIIAGLVALIAAWIADHDIVLTLTAGSYEIRTTAAVAAGLLIVAFAVLWLPLRILFAILSAFMRARGWVSGNRKPLPAAPRATEMLPAPDRGSHTP